MHRKVFPHLLIFLTSGTVHCSGLGGGLLSPDHEYDIFFQMKVYGPSLAMTDDWEQRITQLGLTKTTHEYAVYQLLSTALGWSVWKAFLPGRFADHKLLITRAIRLLTAATIRPAHARPPHPTRLQLFSGANMYFSASQLFSASNTRFFHLIYFFRIGADFFHLSFFTFPRKMCLSKQGNFKQFHFFGRLKESREQST